MTKALIGFGLMAAAVAVAVFNFSSGRHESVSLTQPGGMSSQDLPALFGGSNQNPGGLLGSYGTADSYVFGQGNNDWQNRGFSRGGYGEDWAQRNLGVAPETGATLPGGGMGLASHQLFPSMNMPSDGFDDVLISAPHDFLYADNLMDDKSTLTTTKGQSWDPRGEPAVAPYYSYDETGTLQAGIAGGMYQPSRGPYEYRKPLRTTGVA